MEIIQLYISARDWLVSVCSDRSLYVSDCSDQSALDQLKMLRLEFSGRAVFYGPLVASEALRPEHCERSSQKSTETGRNIKNQ